AKQRRSSTVWSVDVACVPNGKATLITGQFDKAYDRLQVMNTKILIVDDHPLVRQGLIGLLSTQSHFTVCGETSGIAERRQLADAERPDVAIIDITLEDGSGIELIKDLHASFPEMKLLVLTMHDELVFAERALRAGALGYVNKQEVSRSIVKAIREVLNGK